MSNFFDGTTGRWDSTAELALPYYAYRDGAGNYGLHNLDLSLYIGPTVYVDHDLGKVRKFSCFLLKLRVIFVACTKHKLYAFWEFV